MDYCDTQSEYNRAEYMGQFRFAHTEKISAYNKQYRLNHTEEIKKYRLDHIEETRAYNKKYRFNHAEEIKQYRKQYYLNHTKEEKQNQIQYRQSPEGKAIVQRENTARRANLKKALNTLTADEWQTTLEEHDFKCAYCGKDLLNLFDRPTRDHIMPLSKGGDNTKENIAPACQCCNSKKRDK